MSRLLAILTVSLWACTAGQAQSASDEVHLRATVQDVVLLSHFSGKIIPVGFDPRFALTVRIESALPAVPGFAAGAVVTFAIHSPSLLFGVAGETTKGKTYDFSVVRTSKDGKVRFFDLEVRNAQMAPVPASTPAASKQQTAKKDPPTLGFTPVKDVPPVFDLDAFNEETKMQKKLPNNEFVKTKRFLHETALLNEFVEGFKDSKECNGITLYLKTEKKPDFTVLISVGGHDPDPALGELKPDPSWIWILSYPADPGPADSKSHGMGGMGSQTTGKLTARDVCLTVWDDVDPNHFKKPGGKIE